VTIPPPVTLARFALNLACFTRHVSIHGIEKKVAFEFEEAVRFFLWRMRLLALACPSPKNAIA
jgi:hypothetical protein